jgi:SNF2 family DNA or RNA helicase
VAESDAVDREGPFWDYVVLDEAHTVKNQETQIAKACRSVAGNPKTRRLMLTGTPLMNNLQVRGSGGRRCVGNAPTTHLLLTVNIFLLQELWSLFDFATRGRLLGPLNAFKGKFSKPIEKARDKKATSWEVQKGQQMNEQLQKLLRPYFLQRLKVDYLMDQLPPKQEMVVWTDLSADQRDRYSAFIQGERSIVRAILSGATSALVSVTWLKKLCGHPLLVDEQFAEDADKTNSLRAALRSMDREDVLEQSEKLRIVAELIDEFRLNGHRTLVFSQSTRMLDILQSVLSSSRGRVSRIDGSTKEKDRQWLVDEFNSKRSSHDVMLLSTKAAGVGLTLTGADRVILYDPSWNPSEDGQAVDRACK